MDKLNLSVSKLCRFEDYLVGRWGVTQDSLIDYLKGLEKVTFEKDYGSAFHKFLESPEPFIKDIEAGKSITVNNYEISNLNAKKGLEVYNTIPKPHAKESWISKKIVSNGFLINLRGKVDVITSTAIYDYKTTRSKPSWDKYCLESSQHNWYMWMCNAENFVYDVFFLKEHKDNYSVEQVIIEHERYETTYEESYGEKLESTLHYFIDFLKTKGLTELVIDKKQIQNDLFEQIPETKLS